MRAACGSVVLAVLLASSPASAEGPVSVSTPTDDAALSVTPHVALRHDLWQDGAAIAALGGALIAWGATKSSAVAGSSCTLCDGTTPGQANALDDAFRNALRRRNDLSPASTASDVFAYGIGPAMGIALTVVAAGADRRLDEAPLNTVFVLEASLAAMVVSEGLGALVHRERPWVHALTGDAKAAALADGNALSSFPSGRTTSIMAITASSATIATLRGYRIAPMVWAVGTILGLTTTYLELAADHSYLTDNLVGAAVGLGMGTLVPLVFHPRAGERATGAARFLEGASLTSKAVTGGRVVGLGWAF